MGLDGDDADAVFSPRLADSILSWRGRRKMSEARYARVVI